MGTNLRRLLAAAFEPVDSAVSFCGVLRIGSRSIMATFSQERLSTGCDVAYHFCPPWLWTASDIAQKLGDRNKLSGSGARRS